jgi:hypothetical protein
MISCEKWARRGFRALVVMQFVRLRRVEPTHPSTSGSFKQMEGDSHEAK